MCPRRDRSNPTSPARRVLRLALASCLLALAACGPAPSGSTSTPAASPTSGLTGTATATPPAASPTSPAVTTPGLPPEKLTAADDLADFSATARRLDTELRAAARSVNTGVGLVSIRITPATRDAVRAIEVAELTGTIPAGLDDDLLRAVLLVTNDLITRRAALTRVVEYAGESPLDRQGANGRDLIACLGNGAEPAARFAADLAAAEAVAARTAPVADLPADSRQAAEVAIRIAGIRGLNLGCGSCGAPVTRPVQLPGITWKPLTLAPGSEWDGTIGTTPFRATYRTGEGWRAWLNAC